MSKLDLKELVVQFFRKTPLLVICGIIVGFCLYLTYSHYSSVNVSQDLIGRMEAALFDMRFHARGYKKPNSRVGVLAIDEKSIEQFGRWPFSRKYYAQTIKNLKNLGVKWIGFDAVFAEPEKALLKDIEQDFIELAKIDEGLLRNALLNTLDRIQSFKKIASGDRELVTGLKEISNITLGYFYFDSKKEVILGGREAQAFEGLELMEKDAIKNLEIPNELAVKNYSESLKVYGIVPNMKPITESVQHFGFFNTSPDPDGVVRWLNLLKVMENKLMPSLALKTAALAMDRDIKVEFDQRGISGIKLVKTGKIEDSISIPVDLNGDGAALINYRGPGKTYKHFSFADAFNNSFSETERELLRNSVLFVGMTAIGINDQRPTPFDPAFDGVEIHATMTDNIISQNFMQRPKSIFKIELLVLFLIGLVFSLTIVYLKASLAGFAGLLFSICYYYFDKLYWFDNGIWAYISMPYIEMFSLYIGITLYKYIVEEREKRKVKGAFAHYLSQEVIEQVLSSPESLKLGGERKDITVLFSDVRGFTTISEGLSPEHLCEFMNEYFTPMTKIILNKQGVLDKYIGDAIMAFWGAPIPITNHPAVAASAALEMLEATKKLQENFQIRGFPKCEIGIGLNTGPMSVGNMGSDERFCYTVMGDSVNLGSRLEGLTKEYGVKIIASEYTCMHLRGDNFKIRDLDDIRVKGKQESLKIFEVMLPSNFSSEGQLDDLIGLFEEGRKAYREQDWGKAKGLFSKCILIHPDESPARIYLRRIEIYQQKQFIQDWDGVYTFNYK